MTTATKAPETEFERTCRLSDVRSLAWSLKNLYLTLGTNKQLARMGMAPCSTDGLLSIAQGLLAKKVKLTRVGKDSLAALRRDYPTLGL